LELSLSWLGTFTFSWLGTLTFQSTKKVNVPSQESEYT
jgi:hypothetical protein